MNDFSNFKHIDIIESLLTSPINKCGILSVGNNLNTYIDSDKIENYADKLKKRGTDREQKSSKDVLRGSFVEELVAYILEQYFIYNKLDFKIVNANIDKWHSEPFKIVHEKLHHEKLFDIDIIVKNNKDDKKYFLLSCKGSSRERIGQFISNLFLMDDRLIRTKYNDRYYLEFKKQDISIKYGFVCLDWGKNQDFTKYTAKGVPRKTVKQTEVFLINDDYYIGGGVTVLNNRKNLEGVLNFGELVGKIANFLN